MIRWHCARSRWVRGCRWGDEGVHERVEGNHHQQGGEPPDEIRRREPISDPIPDQRADERGDERGDHEGNSEAPVDTRRGKLRRESGGGVDCDDEQRRPDCFRHGESEDEHEGGHDDEAAAHSEESGHEADSSAGDDEAGDERRRAPPAPPRTGRALARVSGDPKFVVARVFPVEYTL